MLQGSQTRTFNSGPVINGSAAVGGPFEAQGALADDFDLLHSDIWLGQDSFEKAEKKPAKREPPLHCPCGGYRNVTEPC
jgi:stage V sporulation protein AD